MPTDSSTRHGLLTERAELYGGGVCVSVTVFPGSFPLVLTVRKQRELGSDRWEAARFATPMRRLETVDCVVTYGRALLLLAEIAAELDAEFPD